MPEIPDFDQIAAPLAEYADDTRRTHIADALRLVWNARGAADREALEPILGANMEHECRVILQLDR